MALNLKGMFNTAIQRGKEFTDKAIEKSKELSDAFPQNNQSRGVRSNSIQKNTSNETDFFKIGFKDFNYLDSKIYDKENELGTWETLDKIINKALANEDNSNEVVCSLNYEESYLFINNLCCQTSIKFFVQEEDGTWKQLNELFKLKKEDMKAYDEKGYFTRNVKIDFSDIDEVIDVAESNKKRIFDEVLASMSSVCKLPSSTRNNDIQFTSSDLRAMQSLLNTIRIDFATYLNQSIVYDLILQACEKYYENLSDEDFENLQLKANTRINEECISNNSLEVDDTLLESKVIPSLGIYDMDIVQNEDGNYFVQLSLSGKKAARLETDIKNARVKLKKEALSKIDNLLNLIS